MRQALVALVLLVLFGGQWVWGVPGDLNKDGVVDFADFFLFADNFGKTGDPEPTGTDTVTVVEVRRDTLERIIEREVTVRDTIFEIRRDTLERIIERTVYDTVITTERDTVELVRERTIRDTIELTRHDTLYSVSYDTIFIPEAPERPAAPRLPTVRHPIGNQDTLRLWYLPKAQ